jgi:uncharacterized membrane protein YdjX (TVP38/TMEM64 family)
VLACLLALGVAAGIWGPLELGVLLEWGAQLASQPLALGGIVVFQALLLTFALPGSLVVWLVAPFQPPWVAAPLLIVGGVLGAIGARAVAARLGEGRIHGPRVDRAMELLAERSDLLTQCAVRAMPGFPHVVINYGAGLLGLPLGTFAAAAVIGLSIKFSVYASAVHGATTAADSERLLQPMTVLPLVALAVFMLISAWLRRRLRLSSPPS